MSVVARYHGEVLSVEDSDLDVPATTHDQDVHAKLTEILQT